MRIARETTETNARKTIFSRELDLSLELNSKTKIMTTEITIMTIYCQLRGVRKVACEESCSSMCFANRYLGGSYKRDMR